MNKKVLFLLFSWLFLLSNLSVAQNVVNVNPLTGAGSVVIPIYTVSSGQVSATVNLVYNGSGIKPKDVEGTAGMGWSIEAGGQVSRLVRGLPDDCTKDNSGAAMLGWMSTNNYGASYASGLTLQNDGMTCSYGNNDVTNINNNIPYSNDTEPDMFYVNAPGLSCELVYDRASAKFHPVVYQDLAISYAVFGGTGNNASNISSFTITNDKGVQYIFSQAEWVTQKTVSGPGSYFGTKYNQYKNGVTYSDRWSLTSINDANGNQVTFGYTVAPVRNSTDPVILYFNGSTVNSGQYNIQQAVSPPVLTTIGTLNRYIPYTTWLTFNRYTYSSSYQTGQTLITSITGMNHNFQFNYSAVAYPLTGNQRQFLRSFTDAGCSTPINYQFSYIGETNSGGSYTTALPDSTSTQIDYWGYYASSANTSNLVPSVYVLNPTISTYPRYAIDVTSSPGGMYQYSLLASNNRAVTASSITNGALNQVTYAAGGSTSIVYEPNDYYDVPSASTVQGGGIRVKQITDAPTSGASNTITRNYSYLNSSGTSSGKPVTLPQFAFTVPYNGTATGQALWTACTGLSAYDLSTEDHTIMYTSCKLSQTGAGSTVYNYNVPATYWDANASPTVDDVGYYSCTSTYGPMKNYSNSYPFIPNPNYDWERGFPSSVVSYNDAGAEVSETDYTYTSLNSPAQITAFKADDYAVSGLMAKSYNKYTIFYNTSSLTAAVTKKVFDSNNQTQAQTSTVNYTYGSAYHNLLTQQSAINSDGSTVTTHYTYSKDLVTATSGTSNDNVTAIYNLQQRNINIPVESYQQLTRGGSTVTTGAALTYFRDTTISSSTNVLPSQQFKWVQANGASFTPLLINGAAMTKDASYFTTANYDIYDNTFFPVTVDDNNKNYQTTVIDHLSGQPTAVFKNAAYNQVAFSDFDTDPSHPQLCNFTISGTGSFTPSSSHAGNAYGLGIGQTVSNTVVKNGRAQNYIFSIWINAATSGTVNVTLNGAPYSVAYTGTGSGSTAWGYHELAMPVTSLTSPLTVSFSSSQNIAIDDILFYPDVAEVSTATYDPNTHTKLAETNTNGVSAYYTYDQWGRMLLQMDQDKNIVTRKAYINTTDVGSITNPVISYLPNTNITTATPVTFTSTVITNNCTTEGLTYTWDFGDGSAHVTTTSATSPAHTYTIANTYTVSLTVSSPFFASKTATTSITVGVATATVTYNNYATGCGISNISFTNSTNSYSFTTYPQTIMPGTYTVTITPSGMQYSAGTGKGYTDIVFTDGANGNCNFYTGGNFTFTWTVAGGDTLNFSVYNNNTCPFN